CSPPVSLLFLLSRRPPGPTPFPYTTLFRSRAELRDGVLPPSRSHSALGGAARRDQAADGQAALRARNLRGRPRAQEHALHARARSEEHTSELQSRENLVCRLLLEKKKNNQA